MVKNAAMMSEIHFIGTGRFNSVSYNVCGFVSGCEALALSGRAACTKPLLAAAADYLEQINLI